MGAFEKLTLVTSRKDKSSVIYKCYKSTPRRSNHMTHKSFMWIRQRVGPKALPCEVPYYIGISSLIKSPIFTHCVVWRGIGEVLERYWRGGNRGTETVSKLLPKILKDRQV